MSDPIQRLNAALTGRYHVERELGEGGMATVYLADDVKHERKVALKVLKPELAAVVGADRFLAEIKTTANLQHPHILPLHDSGEAEGFLYYVMPYVEGESLRERLQREHQLPVDDAVRIASDIAEALHAAHQQGVIHRDVKPANILLSGGRPLVADFGIALAVSAAGGGRLTETGLSMGTPYYMSPEQASADREPTAASDVYSLGCVLYEMLVGEPPYTGGSAQAVLAKILTAQAPTPAAGRASVPANVDAAIRRSLERLPADRFTGAQDLARALRDPGFRHGAEPALALEGAAPRPSNRATVMMAVVAALSLASAVGLAVRRPETGALGVVTLQADVSSGGRTDVAIEVDPSNMGRPSRTALAITPGGETLIFSGQRDGGTPLLFKRDLASANVTAIDGSDGAIAPFVSFDGGSVGFWDDGQLRRVPIEGGPAVTITRARDLGGAHWGEDDLIVYSDGGYTALPGQGVKTVPASGTEEPALVVEGAVSSPHWLPGGQAILFTEQYGDDIAAYRIEAVEVSSGERRTVIDDAAAPWYAPTGHLVFARRGTLMAVPFDPATLSTIGAPAGVLPDVMQAFNGANTGAITAQAQFAFSTTGHLVYLTGGIPPDIATALARVDRSGNVEPLDITPGRYLTVALSPDRSTLALSNVGLERGLYVVDLARSTTPRLLFGGLAIGPTWSPDGRVIAFGGGLWGESQGLHFVTLDGAERPRLAVRSEGISIPLHWGGDGSELLYWNDGNLYSFDPESEESRLVVESSGQHLSLSPDGRWLSYSVSEPTGRVVAVRPYPDVDRSQVVSAGFGTAPRWSGIGNELLYLGLGEDSTLAFHSVLIEADGSASVPAELFQLDTVSIAAPMHSYDVIPERREILVALQPTVDFEPITDVQIVLNWFDYLEALVAR